MIDLDPTIAKDLPVDELAFAILGDLVTTGEWNEDNYLNSASHDLRYAQDGAALYAIAEAFGWLHSRGLIAWAPKKVRDAAIFVTRAGHEALQKGMAHVRAVDRLRQGGLHPLVEQRARRQFLLGEYEQAVFVAMKAVEVRVRELGAFSNDLIGVDLMNKGFGPKGPLTDHAAVKGEQEGTRAMFAGAYAVLRNPSGHRDVDYDDVAEAAEAVVLASLLMRVLDRVEARLAAT